MNAEVLEFRGLPTLKIPKWNVAAPRCKNVAQRV
jgi:hypothetical protein